MKRKLLMVFGAVIGVMVLAVAVCAVTGYVPGPQDFGALAGIFGGGGAVLGLGLTIGAPGGNPQRQLFPFREHTRQKMNSVGTLTYSLGGVQYLTLPKVGYLSKVYLRFNGVITSTTGGADTITYAKFGPWSVFRDIQLDLNSGKQVLCKLSGYELFLRNSIGKKSARPDQQADADFYAAPTTGSAVAFRQTVMIPVAVSDGMNFQVGLINLQAPELQCNLTVAFANALTDIGTNIASLTGTVDVAYEYYEVPDPTQVMQPPVVLHKLISQPQAVLSTGRNIVEIPRGGDLMRVIQVLELNGAKSDSYDSVECWLNKTQQIYKIDRWNLKYRERAYYGYNLPTGVAVWDFQNSWDHPEESDMRDVLDTEAVTTTEFYTNVTAGATLGSNNNFIHTVREFLQIPVG